MKNLVFLLLLLPMMTFAKTEPRMVSAKVISQDIGSSDGGTAVVPLGGALIGVPIVRNSNVVVVEAPHHRITMIEKGNKFIILPVNEMIQYYHDGNWIVILDTRHKKHKFSVMHIEARVQAQNP